MFYRTEQCIVVSTFPVSEGYSPQFCSIEGMEWLKVRYSVAKYCLSDGIWIPCCNMAYGCVVNWHHPHKCHDPRFASHLAQNGGVFFVSTTYLRQWDCAYWIERKERDKRVEQRKISHRTRTIPATFLIYWQRETALMTTTTERKENDHRQCRDILTTLVAMNKYFVRAGTWRLD